MDIKTLTDQQTTDRQQMYLNRDLPSYNIDTLFTYNLIYYTNSSCHNGPYPELAGNDYPPLPRALIQCQE